MIVVVGQPLFRAVEDRVFVDGLPARIALAAASRGGPVQLVGKAGEDPEGDAVVLALAAGGVGHVAFLRDAGNQTPRAPEPSGADLETADVAIDELPNHSIRTPDGSATLDSADIELALRYLTDYSVIVLADPAEPGVVSVVTDAAGWVGARLILVVAPGQAIPGNVPDDAIVFEAPPADPDGAFASLVGQYAAALDGGEDPSAAFRSSIQADGWTASTPG